MSIIRGSTVVVNDFSVTVNCVGCGVKVVRGFHVLQDVLRPQAEGKLLSSVSSVLPRLGFHHQGEGVREEGRGEGEREGGKREGRAIKFLFAVTLRSILTDFLTCSRWYSVGGASTGFMQPARTCLVSPRTALPPSLLPLSLVSFRSLSFCSLLQTNWCIYTVCLSVCLVLCGII